MSYAETIVPDDRRTALLNRVSWGAILAGVVASLVVQLLLNILGVGLGASAIDVGNAGNDPTAGNASLTALGWTVAAGIVASFVGGLVAGRLSGAATRGTASWHGFVSWATATMVIAFLLTSAVGGIVGGTFSALSSTVSGAAHTAASAVGGGVQLGAQSGGTDGLQDKVKQLIHPDDAQTAQTDVTAYVRDTLNGNDSAASADKERAVNSLAKAANVSPDEARTRLDRATQQAKQAADQAKQAATQAAEATRKGVASAGIYGFVALVLGAVAAFLGGAVGAPRRAAFIR